MDSFPEKIGVFPQREETLPESDAAVESGTVTEMSDGDSTEAKQKRPLECDDQDVANEMEPQKKLCRFYFLDHCSKADNCSFMHSEFPCKFYYFGYECKEGNNCKLRHGPALDGNMKDVLWDHVTSAPANLLQRFPCFPNVLLKKNFDDRHHELILMEQEGLLEENRQPLAKDVPGLSAAPSQTLLSEVMKTVSQVKMSGGPFSELGQLVDILAPEQIATLARIGVEKLEQLFELGATALQELGFDLEALIKIGNFKEAKRRTSIYTPDSADEKMESNEIVDSILGSEDLDGSLASAIGEQPALTDQELLSILNEDCSGSTGAADYDSPKQDRAGAMSEVGVGGQFIGSSVKSPDTEECSLRAFPSDAGSECRQLLFYASVKEKENDRQSLDSIQRTVAQLKRIDSLLSEPKEQDVSWGSAESDTSGDYPKHDSSVTDSVNQSFGSDSDSQTCFLMPFKSIINRYTPAKEIDASNGKYPNIQYKLIPIDVPRPSFDRIRRSFVTQPSYSLDPRIQIMFNVGPTEVRHGSHTKVCDRDPRLKKQIDAEPPSATA
ncbi:uncharacterized protein LOC134286824 [Aedes albopictus]|uniref:C3H1-type domain-containing protein n=1 Tax=Aedes albopictus TaxID=7160 RepID=A0ABM1XIT4_AEDAL